MLLDGGRQLDASRSESSLPVVSRNLLSPRLDQGLVTWSLSVEGLAASCLSLSPPRARELLSLSRLTRGLERILHMMAAPTWRLSCFEAQMRCQEDVRSRECTVKRTYSQGNVRSRERTTVKARLWPWLSGKSPQNLFGCSLFARERWNLVRSTSTAPSRSTSEAPPRSTSEAPPRSTSGAPPSSPWNAAPRLSTLSTVQGSTAVKP